MKIEARCGTCGRDFLLSQIGPQSDAPGRCPFCGRHFARHYTTVLLDDVESAEVAGKAFVAALGRLQSMDTGFELKLEDVLATVAEQIRSSQTQRAAG